MERARVRRTAANGREPITSCSTWEIVAKTPAPTHWGAVLTEPAGVKPPAANGDQALARRWRCFAVVIRPPAEGRAVLSERASVSRSVSDCVALAAADSGEPPCRRWPLLVEIRIAPADGRAVLTEPAGVRPTTADSGESLAGRRRCLAGAVGTPADGGAIFAEPARVEPSATYGD